MLFGVQGVVRYSLNDWIGMSLIWKFFFEDWPATASKWIR